MRILVATMFALIALPSLWGIDSVATFELQSQVSEKVDYSGRQDVWIDKSQQLPPQLVFDAEFDLFGKPDSLVSQNSVMVVWVRVRLENTYTQDQQLYITFCGSMDTVSGFVAENSRLVPIGETGRAFPVADKPIFSAANHLPVSLRKGEAKTFYFRLRSNQPMPFSHFKELYARSPSALHIELIEKYSVHSLYTGIMFMFFLLSLFTFLIFKERVFLYFGFIHISFSMYFLVQLGIAAMFLPALSDKVLYTDGAIAAIVISVFLFVNSYTSLSREYPVFFKIYMGVSLTAAALRTLLALVFPYFGASVLLHNYALLVWIVFTFIPVVLLARQGKGTAKNLLTALLVLFFTSLIYVLSLLGVVSHTIWTRNAFQLGTVLFSFLLFYGLFQRIRAIRQERQKIEALGILKSRFFANISHEFRTPLTLLLGPIQRVNRHTKNTEDKKLLDLAEKNAKRLLGLVNQLLDLNKLESGKMRLRAVEENFAELLKGIVMSFESYSEQQNVKLHFVSQKTELPLWVDRQKIEAIFYNLLHNAFKFATVGGEVAVMLVERPDGVEVMVKDNGIGIAEEELPKIFDRFFQVDGIDASPLPGSGIGLALVRELVLLHRGAISVESEKGRGTVFTLKFKKGNGHLQPEEMLERHAPIPAPNILNGDDSFSYAENGVAMGPKSLKTAPVVLIIDDNADVRAYIRLQLENCFQIKEATNGIEGMEMALEGQPDLIISDVMMPGKNGFEVCDTLKKDERTSHIPIILLTARAGQNEKLKGLEYGADDYLIKPFDSEELEVRIRKLIELRTLLRDRIKSNPTLSFKSLTGSPVDVVFMEKVNGIIHDHLEDSQFGVGELAEKIGLSRAHLNRKLNALTDFPANKHIQHLRLKKALELLEAGTSNVSEVAYQTGFNSNAYFVKCFREFYGKTPGSFLVSR